MKLKRKLLIIIMTEFKFTPQFNKFTAEVFNLRLKQANLASKSDIAKVA